MPPTSPNTPSSPPARLLDRLSRRAARRKSSASSRRSSLSSSGRKPTHHVAQHLRRASILETRKARLADRAAHVEAVRTRAALIQAVPKATLSSSEERAMAAAVARQKKLAKVAAACAEEVLKAKQRASDTKARNARREVKARQEMEERWAEADKRRAEYQRAIHARRLRRASSPVRKLGVVLEDDETAVVRIQRTWRMTRRRGVVNTWLGLDFSLDSVKGMRFEELGGLLSSSKLLDALGRMLAMLGVEGNSRTFLTAYLVLTHPDTVFSSQGELEADLKTKARELTVVFEDAVSRLALWNRYTTRLDVHQAYMTYSTAFEAWKANDASALLDVMVATFVEFDAIWTSVKDDTRGHVAEDYKTAIRDNQAMLLSKIRKLSPHADKMIKKAVTTARRGRAKALSPEEQPRTSHSFLPSNRELTHELAINKDFRLTSLGDNRAEMIDLLCSLEGEGWTVAMAECIREKLLALSSGHVREQVETVLEPSHVRSQIGAGVFSHDAFFKFMASVLPKICAPVRDVEIKDLADVLTSDAPPMDKVRKLLQGLDVLALDHANYILAQSRAVLIAEAPGYERRMFAKEAEHGLPGLAAWWAASHGDSRQAIYNKGLVDLIFQDGPWPETLRLDKGRLQDMRKAISDMVSVGATLLTAKNVLKRDVRSAWHVEAGRMLGADADKAFAVLESAHNLPAASQSVLQAACRRFYGPHGMRDPVMRLIVQRLKTHILSRLSASSAEERVRAISTAGESLARAGLPEFVVKIGEIVALLSRIKQVDWEAHGEWYLGMSVAD